MGGTRLPGPICEVRDWFADGQDDALHPWRASWPGHRAPATNVAADARDCAFVDTPSRKLVSAPAAAFERLRAASSAAQITAGRALATHAWPHGRPTAAIERTIQIDGHAITVFSPDATTSAQLSGLPSVVQVASALRAVPSKHRRRTAVITLSPWPSPGSRPDKTVAGEAGPNDITLFPMSGQQSQLDVDNRVMHESGHNVQAGKWGSGAAVQAWSDAAQRDARRPSLYANEGAGEDFCEFYILYITTKGTPCESETTRLYPNRWALMAGAYAM